jgi:hypothetical protein
MFGMHAARWDLETLSYPERDRVVVTGDGNFPAQDKGFGVEAVAVIGRDQVRLQAAVHDPEAVATQVRYESRRSSVILASAAPAELIRERELTQWVIGTAFAGTDFAAAPAHWKARYRS